jgi:hypothetical protein
MPAPISIGARPPQSRLSAGALPDLYLGQIAERVASWGSSHPASPTIIIAWAVKPDLPRASSKNRLRNWRKIASDEL